jgi:hypothetical protein
MDTAPPTTAPITKGHRKGGDLRRRRPPVKMFRKHYDKYLENYQGYVELAERLYRARDNGEVPPGSKNASGRRGCIE